MLPPADYLVAPHFQFRIAGSDLFNAETLRIPTTDEHRWTRIYFAARERMERKEFARRAGASEGGNRSLTLTNADSQEIDQAASGLSPSQIDREIRQFINGQNRRCRFDIRFVLLLAQFQCVAQDLSHQSGAQPGPDILPVLIRKPPEVVLSKLREIQKHPGYPTVLPANQSQMLLHFLHIPRQLRVDPILSHLPEVEFTCGGNPDNLEPDHAFRAKTEDVSGRGNSFG